MYKDVDKCIVQLNFKFFNRIDTKYGYGLADYSSSNRTTSAVGMEHNDILSLICMRYLHGAAYCVCDDAVLRVSP